MNDYKLIIFSAPSGAGKTTIVRHLLAHNSDLEFSISATTRAKRPNEVHGRDYYFLSLDDFDQKLRQDEFLEYQQVYDQIYYGTLKSDVDRIRRKGKHVIFDVDVKGGLNLKQYYKENALAVFVKVPSVQILADRLAARNTESEKSKAERIAKATAENAYESQFDIVLINDQLEETLCKAQEILDAFLKKTKQK